jgi:hypothetical protein
MVEFYMGCLAPNEPPIAKAYSFVSADHAKKLAAEARQAWLRMGSPKAVWDKHDNGTTVYNGVKTQAITDELRQAMLPVILTD